MNDWRRVGLGWFQFHSIGLTRLHSGLWTLDPLDSGFCYSVDSFKSGFPFSDSIFTDSTLWSLDCRLLFVELYQLYLPALAIISLSVSLLWFNYSSRCFCCQHCSSHQKDSTIENRSLLSLAHQSSRNSKKWEVDTDILILNGCGPLLVVGGTLLKMRIEMVSFTSQSVVKKISSEMSQY